MKTIQIGPWDGDQASIQVADTATLNDALREAGLSLAPSQSITTLSDTQDLGLNDVVQNGETYLLTGNQVSGLFSYLLNFGGVTYGR